MHGNTFTAQGGRKTRHFDDILAETAPVLRGPPGAEGPGRAACTSNSPATTSPSAWAAASRLDEGDLETNYTSICDPRLNATQSLDMAFHVAEYLRDYAAGSGATSL